MFLTFSSAIITATTILDINYFTTHAKYGQRVLFRERAKSAYFWCASSGRDNKRLFVLGLGTNL